MYRCLIQRNREILEDTEINIVLIYWEFPVYAVNVKTLFTIKTSPVSLLFVIIWKFPNILEFSNL